MSFLKTMVVLVAALLLSALAHAADGLIVVQSNHTVAETADRLEAVWQWTFPRRP